MSFSKKSEETFAHGINIQNNYQLFHLWTADKLLDKFRVNYLPILNYRESDMFFIKCQNLP